MRLAFSTLGCPGDTLRQVLELARVTGSSGVELRAGDAEIVHAGMNADQRGRVRSELTAGGVSVLALASYVRVCAPEADGNDSVLAELLAAVDLAADLGATHVRVFPGAGLPPHTPGTPLSAELIAADQLGAARLNAAAGLARDRGVVLALETHDSHPRAADIKRILAHVDPGAPVKVIWDLMHPWRHDEAPETTAALLADSLAYAQYKDGVRVPGTNTVELLLPGQGELPLLAMQALVGGIARAHGDLNPWISLEWERAWHPELPPLRQALDSLKELLA
ncbi:sugar phosphate isomerase/epimerase [Arthrobacter sp. GMC3]|uniref:sugar phosphate isomerase/epimerase family protein n=1 Tax=Arthrobacter sp. GMC3 TaxID=2058894 RepID=UPI000CE30059|nr:sugar phosphate isomerase/epimerase family protein [Arthrobacter sp. GMC3]